jgi:glycosyltransferase involved in cell wall biosynthesis
MNLKVLIYAHSWAPSLGGVETTTKLLAQGLAQYHNDQIGDSINVTLVTLTLANGMDDSVLPFHVVRRPSLWGLIRLVYSADIVHLAGPALVPLALSWLLKKRSVIEHDNYQSMCPNGLLIHQPDLTICPGHFLAGNYRECLRCNSLTLGRAKSLRDLFLAFPRRWLAKKVAANVAPSRHMKTRAALPRTRIIYHGVVVDASPKSSDGQAHTPVCFAFVGRLVKEKGVSVLLHCAHELAAEGCDFRLRIIGDGPERTVLEAMAENLALKNHVEFKGAMPAESISNAISEAIAVIMPSTWEDVAPLVALEQMMQGRLVIAADVGGLGEIVNEFGLTFPVGDVAALKERMRQAIENPNLSIQMGRRAQINAMNKFSQERTAAEHLRLYREILQSDSPPTNTHP